jgi:hypothetical protein
MQQLRAEHETAGPFVPPNCSPLMRGIMIAWLSLGSYVGYPAWDVPMTRVGDKMAKVCHTLHRESYPNGSFRLCVEVQAIQISSVIQSSSNLRVSHTRPQFSISKNDRENSCEIYGGVPFTIRRDGRAR